MRTLKYIKLTAMCLLLNSFAFSQFDLSLSSSFKNSVIGVGQTDSFILELTNLTLTAASIPQNSLAVQIEFPSVNYSMDTLLANQYPLFKWSHPIDDDTSLPILNTWIGINVAGPIPFAQTIRFAFPILGVIASTSNTQVNSAFLSGTDSQPSNNASVAGLTVSSVLPVEYVNFTVTTNDCHSPQLEWGTASESNNKGFNIERASDEGDFKVIGFVESHHNSAVKREYTFTDKSAPKNGNFKYRIDAIDYDGKNTLSDVVSVDFTCFSETQVTLFPNPTTDRITVYFEDKTGEALEANILDQAGKSALKTMVKANVKNNVSVATLPEGIYNLQIARNGIISSKRFIKVN